MFEKRQDNLMAEQANVCRVSVGSRFMKNLTTIEMGRPSELAATAATAAKNAAIPPYWQPIKGIAIDL